MLNTVKEVRNWWKFGRVLIGEGIVHVDEDGESYTNLELIEHESNDARIRAIVKDFLDGGLLGKKPTWRAVVWSLIEADESKVANEIRNYAEPVQGVYACEFVAISCSLALLMLFLVVQLHTC